MGIHRCVPCHPCSATKLLLLSHITFPSIHSFTSSLSYVRLPPHSILSFFHRPHTDLSIDFIPDLFFSFFSGHINLLLLVSHFYHYLPHPCLTISSFLLHSHSSCHVYCPSSSSISFIMDLPYSFSLCLTLGSSCCHCSIPSFHLPQFSTLSLSLQLTLPYTQLISQP